MAARDAQWVRCRPATRASAQLLEGRWGEGRSGTRGLGENRSCEPPAPGQAPHPGVTALTPPPPPPGCIATDDSGPPNPRGKGNERGRRIFWGNGGGEGVGERGERGHGEMGGANRESCKGKPPESQCGSSPRSPPAGEMSFILETGMRKDGEMVQRRPDSRHDPPLGSLQRGKPRQQMSPRDGMGPEKLDCFLLRRNPEGVPEWSSGELE